MYDLLNVYLENGLHVMMHRIPQTRTMACGIWVKQGSKHESDAQSGISHLVEHLLINVERSGRPHYQALMSEVIEEGVIYNAATTKEYTSFFMSGLNTSLIKCLEALSAMVTTKPIFSKDCIDLEKRVVLQEATSFYSSFNQIKERTNQALWGNMGVGRPIIGNLDVIQGCTEEAIFELIHGAYTPENSTLVIVGGIEYSEVLKYVEEFFSHWEDRSTRKYQDVYEDAPGIYVNQSKGSSSSAISVGFRQLNFSQGMGVQHEIIAKVLGDASFESRLMQEIRIKRGLVYSLGAFTNFYNEKATLGFTAVCSNQSVNEVVKIMIEEFEKARTKGITESELNRTKKVLQTKKLLELESVLEQLKFLGRCAVVGKHFSLELDLRALKAVTREDINTTMQIAFQPGYMGYASIGDYDVDEVLMTLTE